MDGKCAAKHLNQGTSRTRKSLFSGDFIMNKNFFLCGTLIVGICLTNGCRSYHGYREFTTTEDAGIEDKKLISQKKELFQDSGKFKLFLFQEFSYIQKYKKTTYEEYIYKDSSASNFIVGIIRSPITCSVALAFSPFFLLASGKDIEYHGETYHFSAVRRWWNTLNPVLRHNLKAEKTDGTEIFKEKEIIQKTKETTTENYTQDGETVYFQYEGIKTPIAIKVPFTKAELAKQIFKYALPPQPSVEVTITGDMGAKLTLYIASLNSLSIDENTMWLAMTAGKTEAIFKWRHEFLAQLKNWKGNSIISPETEAETSKHIISKSREYIIDHLKKLCETDASKVSLTYFQKLKNDIEQYCREGLISEKEKVDLSLNFSPLIEKKLKSYDAASVTKNLSTLKTEIAEYKKLGFITGSESKKFENTLLEIVQAEKERRLTLMYPLHKRFKPIKLYKNYNSGYSCAYLNADSESKDSLATALAGIELCEKSDTSFLDQPFIKLLPTKKLNPRNSEEVFIAAFKAQLGYKEIPITTNLGDGIQGIFACSPYSDEYNAYLIAVELTRNLALSDTEKKFLAEYPGLKIKRQVYPVDIPLPRTELRIVGTKQTVILENDDIYIHLASEEVPDAKIIKKGTKQRQAERKAELKRKIKEEQDMADAFESGAGETYITLKVLKQAMDQEKKELDNFFRSTSEQERCEIELEKVLSRNGQSIFICDKKLLNFFSEKYQKVKRAEAEKRRQEKEAQRKRDLDF